MAVSRGTESIGLVLFFGMIAGCHVISLPAHLTAVSSCSDEDVKLTHVPFGLVLGEDGKKIKTRSGESVKLMDLLQEAVRIAQESFEQRYLESGSTSSKEEVAHKSRVMGLAAVKYADLSMNRESNYRFSFQKMLSLQGNTAPYMLYAYVRIQGIKRKAAGGLLGEQSDTLSPEELDNHLKALFSKHFASSSLVLTKPEEIALVKHLLRFDETVHEVADKFYPNKVSQSTALLSPDLTLYAVSCVSISSISPRSSIASMRPVPCSRPAIRRSCCRELLSVL